MKRKLGGDVVGSHQVIDSRSLDWTTVSRSRASEKGDARLSDKEAVKRVRAEAARGVGDDVDRDQDPEWEARRRDGATKEDEAIGCATGEIAAAADD